VPGRDRDLGEDDLVHLDAAARGVEILEEIGALDFRTARSQG